MSGEGGVGALVCPVNWGKSPLVYQGISIYSKVIVWRSRLMVSHGQHGKGVPMQSPMILLVEDNPDDEVLTLHALKKSHIGNRVFVARDGAEALDFLFCRNQYADRDPHNMRQLSLLDIKLLKMDGLNVLYHLRVDQRTKRLPVVLLTSSKEVQDLVEGYKR